MLRFWFCVAGIYTCFLTWGVLQERVTTTVYTRQSGSKWTTSTEDGKFTYFVALNLIQAICAALVACIYLVVTRKGFGLPPSAASAKGKLPAVTTRSALLWKYVETAFLNSIASPFGYESLKHIDYPTLTLGKSCKLVPVMLMHWVLYRKKFATYKYVSVAIITTGVSLFMLLHPRKASGSNATSGAVEASSMYGLGLLMINLLIDGATNSSQDHIFSRFNVNGQQMMFFMNAIGAFFMTAALLVWPWTTELGDAVRFLQLYPEALRDIVLFGVCGALGQMFIFYTLATYGSISLVTVTVTRKLFTMLLSVFYYNHRLNVGQWASVALVFFGIAMEEYYKKQEKTVKFKPK